MVQKILCVCHKCKRHEFCNVFPGVKLCRICTDDTFADNATDLALLQDSFKDLQEDFNHIKDLNGDNERLEERLKEEKLKNGS